MEPFRSFNSTARVALGLACLLGCAAPVRAQGVPVVSGDFTSGSGTNGTHAGELWFRGTRSQTASADFAVRIGGSGPTRPVLLLGYAFDFVGDKENADCRFAPNGTCRSNFAAISGPSIGVGLRQALGRWVLVGIGGGVASYHGQARFVEADASLRLFPHFAIVSEFRYIDLPVAGQRTWFRPLTFGARAYL